jgi:IMP dehydrogenase
MEIEFSLYLTFDDILIAPGYSEILPSEVDLTTRLTRKIKMNIPIISAAMDTVTEAEMAIEMAKAGGIGIIHRNLTPEEQAKEVEKVKKYSSWIIRSPIHIDEETTVGEAMNLMKEYGISGLPVVKNGYLVGIVTARDLRFETEKTKKVKEVMTPKSKLIVVKEGISQEEAKKIMHKNKVEKLPVVDDEFKLKGLITLKDISKAEENPVSLRDENGRLMVGAAVGVGETELERIKELIKAGVDVIVIDSAHGHSKGVIEMLRKIKEKFDVEVIAGNVATAEGAKALAKEGADAIKIGVGPGSICTTRLVTGVGVPQISAIIECKRAIEELGLDIPIIADGGIRYPGDIAKALVVGADSVMLGNMLAGTEEAPGEKVIRDGRPYKIYRGMGSEDAIKDGMKKGVRSRYLTGEAILPEGVVGLVPYKGPVKFILSTIEKAIKASFGYIGGKNIQDARKKAKIIRITEAGYKESHVHDVQVIKETIFPFGSEHLKS